MKYVGQMQHNSTKIGSLLRAGTPQSTKDRNHCVVEIHGSDERLNRPTGHSQTIYEHRTLTLNLCSNQTKWSVTSELF